MGHFLGGKKEDMGFTLLFFRCKCLMLHCPVIPTLCFPTQRALISSAFGNTGKKIPYRQEMEGAGLSYLLLRRIGRRSSQIPSYLMSGSTFSGMPCKKPYEQSHWRCLPDANGCSFTRLLHKRIQITRLNPGKDCWAG